MRVLWLLAQISLPRFLVAIFLSALSGVAAMAALVCLLEAVRSGSGSWWQFAAVAAFSVVIARYSRVALSRLGSKSMVRLRRRLVRSILRMPLIDLERVGPTRLAVAFASDVVKVSSAARNLASLFSSTAFLLALLAYVGWLSPPVMAVTSLLCLVCVGGAIVLRVLEQRHHRLTREAWDRLPHLFTMMLDGIKELKLNRPLTRRVLVSFEDGLRDYRQSSGARARYSDLVVAWIGAMFYVILGVAVFGPFGDQNQLKVGFGLLALLRIRRPLGALLVDSRAFSDASVALQRIEDVGLTLSEDARDDQGAQEAPASARHWRTLKLQNVTFRYETDNNDDNFVLGPINMTLRRSAIIFIAGGNGSGKTTLVKVLTGLYAPTTGAIVFDGHAIDRESIRWYRKKFAAVFSDFHLFEGIPDPRRDNLDDEAEQLAVRLKLERWLVAATDPCGKAAAVSSGERRRAALLMALLEDRPILVFDEWAVDQDPQFKDLFYLEILPALREVGKLVIAVSHDERYFHKADRVLWLERGKPPLWRSHASFAETAKPVPDWSGGVI